MIELPGSFSGNADLAEAGARPRGEPAHVVGDLDERRRERLQRAVREDDRVVRGERLELVRRGDERQARAAPTSSAATRAPNSGGAFSPVPTAVPPSASSPRCGSALAHVRQAVIELRDPARDLLAERERRRVLQVRAADLDDRPRTRRPCRASVVAQARRRAGSSRADERLDRGDAHRRREDVVRRLAAVDVVVRMHEAAFADRAAEQLRGAVGEHLVHVHVALRAGAGLPDRERELVVVPAGEDFVGGGDDRVGLLGRRACRGRG